MATRWTLRPLCYGEFPALDRSIVTYNRGMGEPVSAPIVGWLLESASDAILVDTGPSIPEAACRWHPAIRQAPDERPPAALRAAGVDPESLRTVVLTHLHWDHCYNLECFPRARVLVQAAELRAAVDPVATQRRTYEVGLPGVRPPWLMALDRLAVLRGDTDIAPGVRTLLLPGHTPGLQGILVDTEAGRYLLASDGAPRAENVGSSGSEPIPPGIHTDVATSLHSLARMRREADVVLPGHDPSVFHSLRYP